jgi:pteridine reductase
MRVAVHYHGSAEGAEQTCAAVREAGGEAFSLQADLSDRTEVRQLVDTATRRLGGLDLLVPSAANFESVDFDSMDDGDWDRAMRLNLEAPAWMAHQAREPLRQAHGSIVLVTCTSASTPFRGYLPYVVSKGAVRQLMRVLSLEFAPEVRVNAVAPGTVLPPEHMDDAQLAAIRGRIPLGRTGQAEDVADAVVYLAGAPFVTGHELVVDGGRTVAGLPPRSEGEQA